MGESADIMLECAGIDRIRMGEPEMCEESGKEEKSRACPICPCCFVWEHLSKVSESDAAHSVRSAAKGSLLSVLKACRDGLNRSIERLQKESEEATEEHHTEQEGGEKVDVEVQ